MKVSTILGIPYLHLEQENNYHLALAHLMADKTYRGWFKEKSRRGDFTIMDNGVVETGLPMEWSLLKELGEEIEASELVLPDRLYDLRKTIDLGKTSLSDWDGERNLMAVPQGRDFDEWKLCLDLMLEWPVQTIGISKFIGVYAPSRVDVLKQTPELLESDKAIHLLGCISISDEVTNMEEAFPGRVRGIDSGIAIICAQAGMKISSFIETGGRLDIPLDFFASGLDEDLLTENVRAWRALCGHSTESNL